MKEKNNQVFPSSPLLSTRFNHKGYTGEWHVLFLEEIEESVGKDLTIVERNLMRNSKGPVILELNGKDKMLFGKSERITLSEKFQATGIHSTERDRAAAEVVETVQQHWHFPRNGHQCTYTLSYFKAHHCSIYDISPAVQEGIITLSPFLNSETIWKRKNYQKS